MSEPNTSTPEFKANSNVPDGSVGYSVAVSSVVSSVSTTISSPKVSAKIVSYSPESMISPRATSIAANRSLSPGATPIPKSSAPKSPAM